ncbi:MAG: hypothetical protein ACRDZ8_17710 [Acidimicrobiales bacterium]
MDPVPPEAIVSEFEDDVVEHPADNAATAMTTPESTVRMRIRVRMMRVGDGQVKLSAQMAGSSVDAVVSRLDGYRRLDGVVELGWSK